MKGIGLKLLTQLYLPARVVNRARGVGLTTEESLLFHGGMQIKTQGWSFQALTSGPRKVFLHSV